MSKNNRAKPKLSMMNFLYLRLLLASLLVPNTAATQSDVIIIGAGATGMSAAKTLLA
jgi:ribulose 1,5-bisphosphate synthetase/thiazole synthase